MPSQHSFSTHCAPLRTIRPARPSGTRRGRTEPGPLGTSWQRTDWCGRASAASRWLERSPAWFCRWAEPRSTCRCRSTRRSEGSRWCSPLTAGEGRGGRRNLRVNEGAGGEGCCCVRRGKQARDAGCPRSRRRAQHLGEPEADTRRATAGGASRVPWNRRARARWGIEHVSVPVHADQSAETERDEEEGAERIHRVQRP